MEKYNESRDMERERAFSSLFFFFFPPPFLSIGGGKLMQVEDLRQFVRARAARNFFLL